MTVGEARQVWQRRHEYDQATVDYAIRILEGAGEL